MSSLTEQISRAWEFRLSQNFEECRTLLAQIKQELRVPVGVLSQAKTHELFDALEFENLNNLAQVFMLTASLLRSEGQLDASKQLIQTIENELLKKQVQLPFQLYFQKSINFVADHDYSSALETFLTSRYHTTRIEEKVFALSNAMFCLDNLGLSFEKTKAEIEGLIRQMPEKKSQYFQQSIAQLNAFDIRDKIRQGNFAAIFDTEYEKSNSFGQAEYLKAYVQSLPYHSRSLTFDKLQLEEFSLSNPYFYKKSYRLRTLQGLIHPHDATDFNESEFADRLYLWTWRWLVAPSKFPLSRILSMIKSVDLVELSKQLTEEDFHLVRNSLYWMSLFDPTSFDRVEKVTQNLRMHQGRELPLHMFESDMLNYLFAVRDKRELEAQDYLANLMSNPLWNQKSLYFSNLIESLNDQNSTIQPVLQTLLTNLRGVLRAQDVTHETNADVVIDLSTDRIKNKKTNETVTSEAMSRAFDILHRKASVTCDEFLLVTFGLHNYEPLMHDQKIFNLLARMRTYDIANLRIGVKSGKVFAIGSWSDVSFVRPLNDEYRVDNKIEWQSLVGSGLSKKVEKEEVLQKWIKPNLLIKKLSGKPEFSREDIEQLAGTSRSTANRLIKSWLDQGLLGKRGNARNTVYFLKQEIGKERGHNEISL